MTSTPDIISVLVCGPTSTDGVKGQILLIPDFAIAGKVIRRLISAEVITVTGGTGALAKIGKITLKNGVPNHDYAAVVATTVALDDKAENTLVFGDALTVAQLIWIKVEVLAPNNRAVCVGTST